MNEQQITPHDWRGVPIEVGAIVVYPSRQSSSTWMNEGIVVSVEPDGYDYRGEPEWKVGVTKTQEGGFIPSVATKPKSGRVAYPSMARLTVVGRPEPRLRLERKNQQDTTGRLGGGAIMFTPAIDEDYWTYRVVLSEKQAIVGFPKFDTIGIGFAVEDDWNTNLPYTCTAEEIHRHIAHNKGDDTINDADVLEAIRLVQAAAQEDRP